MRNLLAALVLLMTFACGGSPVLNPKYQPEVTNLTNSFGFQLTGVQNGTGTLSYTWQNTGTRATIDTSSAISAGTATLVLKDAVGAQVYAGSLATNGSLPTMSGQAGAWTIVIDFTNATGTINFRAQTL
ncbi:MAG: hypothetical protein NVS4B2_31190 [Chloroflexota bacterium]